MPKSWHAVTITFLWQYVMVFCRSWQYRGMKEQHLRLSVSHYSTEHSFIVYFRLQSMFIQPAYIRVWVDTCTVSAKLVLVHVCVLEIERVCSIETVVWAHWCDNTPLSLQNWWRGFYSSHCFTLYSLSWITCQQNTAETFRSYITCTRMIVSSSLIGSVQCSVFSTCCNMVHSSW